MINMMFIMYIILNAQFKKGGSRVSTYSSCKHICRLTNDVVVQCVY